MLQIQAESQKNPTVRLALVGGGAFFVLLTFWFAYNDLTSVPAAVADAGQAVKGV